MKFLMMFAILVGATTANATATVSSSVAVTNHYIFRGISQSEGNAAVQASMDYTTDFGLAIGLWISNTTSAIGPEFDQYFTYTRDVNGWALWVGMTRYEYNETPGLTTIEPEVGFTKGNLKFFFGYTDRWFGVKTDSEYANLTYTHPVDANLGVVGSVSYTAFGDTDKTGFKNYIDYRIAGQYTKETVTTELGFWDTDREDLAGKDFKDSRVYIKVSKTF